MYREDSWQKGHYIDNHVKLECYDCGKQFIVGEKLLEGWTTCFPICPYCGQSNVERVAWTSDEELGELASEIGCLGIYIDL